MKKTVALILAACLSLTLFAGCNNSAGGGDVKYLDNYKTTFSTSIDTLNPFVIGGTAVYDFIANTMDSLVETDNYGRYIPSLAESWETNDDLTVWTFKIREGQYFIDYTGQKTQYEITAASWVESLRYAADPMNDANHISIIRNAIAGLKDYYWALSDIDDGTDTTTKREDVLKTFDETVGVKAVDKYTLEYTLSGPTPYFLSLLLLETFVPIAPEFVAEKGEDFGTSAQNLLYSGAYYMSQWDRDKLIVLNANENYWDKEKVTLKKIQFEKVSDSVSQTEMFQRGEIHAITLSSEEVAAVRSGDFGKYIYLSDKGTGTYWFYFFHQSPNPEFRAAVDNENFRKAIYYALDRSTLSAIWEPNDPDFFVRNTLQPEDTMFDEDGVDYTNYPALKSYKETTQFDATKAREYMDKAIAELTEADGVTLKGVSPEKVSRLPITEFNVDGKLPIDILYTSGSSESELKKSLLVKKMLEDYLGKENVNIILGYASDSFSTEVWPQGNWDLVDDNFSFRFADPSANLNRITSEYDLNDSQYVIPDFDKMVEDASNTFDIKERFTKYSVAEAWMMEHAYIIPYMTTGGAYRMTYLVPYSTPQGKFGLSGYKYKGALVQDVPVTNEQHQQLKEKHDQELADLAKK